MQKRTYFWSDEDYNTGPCAAQRCERRVLKKSSIRPRVRGWQMPRPYFTDSLGPDPLGALRPPFDA